MKRGRGCGASSPRARMRTRNRSMPKPHDSFRPRGPAGRSLKVKRGRPPGCRNDSRPTDADAFHRLPRMNIQPGVTAPTHQAPDARARPHMPELRRPRTLAASSFHFHPLVD